jgi:hypothetical protein
LQSPPRYPTTPHQATSSSYLIKLPHQATSSSYLIKLPHQATSMTPHPPFQSSGKKKKRCYKETSDDDGTAKKCCHRKSIATSFLYSIECQAADLKQGENDMKGIAKFDRATQAAQLNLKSSQKKREISDDNLARVKKEKLKQHEIIQNILENSKIS